MENIEGATAAEIDALTEMGEQLINAILERRPIKVINELVQSGAPLWYQNVEGTSALHAAAYTENEEVAHMLIDEGSPWNAGMCYQSFDCQSGLDYCPCIQWITSSVLLGISHFP